MGRQPRIEYPEALCHVMARGDRRTQEIQSNPNSEVWILVLVLNFGVQD